MFAAVSGINLMKLKGEGGGCWWRWADSSATSSCSAAKQPDEGRRMSPLCLSPTLFPAISPFIQDNINLFSCNNHGPPHKEKEALYEDQKG